MSILKPSVWGTLLLVFLLGGCAPTYRGEFMADAETRGWTREQKLAAYYHSLRLQFLKRAEDGTFAVVYSRLSKEDVIKQLESNLTTIEGILDYKDEEWNKFLKLFGLRPQLERQEFILKAVLARIFADENDKKFKEFLGETTAHGSATVPALRGYDEKALTIVDLPKAFPFQSKVLEEARALGLVKEIARTTKTDARTLYQKEPDPNDPTDKAKFVWVARTIAYERVEFKVLVPDEQPQASNPNYVEIWRLVDGKRESSPAVKAFLDGKGSALLVLDTEKENETIGFGLPNTVERISESDLYGDALIARVFPDLKKDRRIEPKIPPIRVEIVRAGSPVDPWQSCTETGGCRTPKSYRREPTKDNYNVRVHLKAEKKKDSPTMALSIEHVAKEWTDGSSEYSWSPGKVIEYYKPKAVCTASALLSAKVLHYESKKKVRIVCKDGTETDRVVTPSQNVVIEDKPYQMAFTVGETRWLVWDSDGDGVFDKRRKIAPTLKNDVGFYRSDVEISGGDGAEAAAAPAASPAQDQCPECASPF